MRYIDELVDGEAHYYYKCQQAHEYSYMKFLAGNNKCQDGYKDKTHQ